MRREGKAYNHHSNHTLRYNRKLVFPDATRRFNESGELLSDSKPMSEALRERVRRMNYGPDGQTELACGELSWYRYRPRFVHLLDKDLEPLW